MSSASDRTKFRELAARNLGQLLLRAARLLDERALERVRDRPGGIPIRPAHTRLFPHLRLEGVRSTELAERLGITKQAVAPLIADLIAWGLLESVPDPSDGRARLLRWTEAGMHGMVHGLTVLQEFELALVDRVGHADVDTTRRVLGELLALLDPASTGP